MAGGATKRGSEVAVLGKNISFNKKGLYAEKSPSHVEKTSSQHLGREGAQSGALTDGPVTLERPQTPQRDPVRKELRNRE